MVDNRIGIIGVIFVCILFSFYSAADELDEQYIGCYQDNVAVRDLENEINLASMTIFSCIEHCRNNSKTYAGAQNGSKCFCGDTYGTYGQSQECKVNCPGNASYYCGGNLQNSIYSVCPISRYGISCNRECHCFKDAPCNLVSGSCPTGCATGWGGYMCNGTSASQLSHYGCFTDAREYGFPIIFNDPQMTIQMCMDRCRTDFALYAGLQFGQHCCCGNSSYSANGISSLCGKNECSTINDCRCAGSPSDRCGGPMANDVYSTCQDGYYGVLCSHQCHCFQGSNCTMEDGTCPQGGCSEGWMGTSCNIRNCADNNGNCLENEICTYENAGEGEERVVPRCRCREGYTRNQEYEDCADIDECMLAWPSNQCNSKFGDCFNLEGTYNCTCKAGFQNHGSTVCEDINECELFWPDNQCNSAFGECVNLEGTHDCKCNVGFHQNNGSIACEDIDECLLDYPDNECNITTGNCTNTLGNYVCNCFHGFSHIDSDKYCMVSETNNESNTALIVGLVVGLGVPIIAIAMIAIAIILYKRKQTNQQNQAEVYTTLDVKRSVPLEMPQQDMHVYTELQKSPVNHELQNDHHFASENHESVG